MPLTSVSLIAAFVLWTGCKAEPSPHLDQSSQNNEDVGQSASSTKKQIESGPRAAKAPKPSPPKAPFPYHLEVPGFEKAVLSVPATQKEPLPVFVVLHGNYDRPEWECEIWRPIIQDMGYVLCPRGVPVSQAPEGADRWTYPNYKAMRAEVEAAIEAIKNEFPGKIADDGYGLIGFSLGAIYGPRLIVDSGKRYKMAFFVEGGMDQLSKSMVRTLKKAGVEGIGLAMSGLKRIKKALASKKLIKQQGMRFLFVDMRGAGHAYSDDFESETRSSIEWLYSGE